MPRKSTTQEFIEKSKARYGENAFDYSACEYKSNRTKVLLYCNTHKIYFSAIPNSHLTRTCGCPECGKFLSIKKRSLGSDEFIRRSKERFGGAFDYSSLIYKSQQEDVTLFCKKHNGYIQINPYTHLHSKTGCQICSKNINVKKQKISKDEFIKRSKEKFGQKFDYSNLDYIDYQTETELLCKLHGVFRVRPWYHLLYANGGCPECLHYYRQKSNSGMSTAEFVEKLKKLYKDNYDYSETDYFSYKKKVSVRCLKHDCVFQRLPETLLKGVGCPKCEQDEIEKYQKNKVDALKKRRVIRESIAMKRKKALKIRGEQKRGMRYDIARFVKIAREIHGEAYYYKDIEIKNLTTPITIHCNYHNYDFVQTPQKHLLGQGCPKCIGRHRTTKDFINEAICIHGDRFDYSHVHYKDCYHKVEILCKKHNKKFCVLPIKHLEGQGCPECCKSALELRLIAYLSENTDYTLLTQHQFSWLKTTRSMPLDIYIPKLNIAIECQGLQHFFARPQFGGLEGLNRQKEKDKLKYELCKKNGIQLVYYVDKGYPTEIEYYGRVFNKLVDLVTFLKVCEKGY